MIIVYLSGKMTGIAESEYKENFRNAEMFYRACGYEVVYINFVEEGSQPKE